MAHRCSSAASKPKTTTDPKSKNHPKTTTTQRHAKHPDPAFSPAAKQSFPAHAHLNLLHKYSKSANPPPHFIDIRLQAKAMSLSTFADSSKTFLMRPNTQNPAIVADKHRQDRRIIPVTSTDKERLKMSSVKKVMKKKEYEHKLYEANGTESSEVLQAVGGRRRSFCSSQTELVDFLTCNGVRVVSADMPPFMQIHAVNCARETYDSLEKFTSKTLAFTLKKEFDGVYGPAWHCIVGTSFGSFVTHSVGGFLYFSMDQKLYVLLFKTSVQRAH